MNGNSFDHLTVIDLGSNLVKLTTSEYGTIYLLPNPKLEQNPIVLKKYNESTDRDKTIEIVIMKYLQNYPYIGHVYDYFFCRGIYGMLMPYYKHHISSL